MSECHLYRMRKIELQIFIFIFGVPWEIPRSDSSRAERLLFSHTSSRSGIAAARLISSADKLCALTRRCPTAGHRRSINTQPWRIRYGDREISRPSHATSWMMALPSEHVAAPFFPPFWKSNQPGADLFINLILSKPLRPAAVTILTAMRIQSPWSSLFSSDAEPSFHSCLLPPLCVFESVV